MTSVHRHSRMTSVRGTIDIVTVQYLWWNIVVIWQRRRLRSVGYTGGDNDVQNQLDEIIRNKAIYQKVANAMAERD